MKIQQLTIHNIASIEDAVIDFEASPLADSEVFLITGKTGAGKSTLLDAICLALYADTPRLDGTKMEGGTQDGDKSIGIDDPRQLMRRNTGEAFTSLTFIGNNGVHYKATWTVTRANKRLSGNLQRKSWNWENLDNGSSIDKDADIKAEIKNAIGLDFDQFCRTTLLAQGEFTRFLNSKDEEKAKILEKITGVDVYSKIGAKVFELTSQRKQAWEQAQQMMEGISTLTEEEIGMKRNEINDLDKAFETCKQHLELDKAKRQWMMTDAECVAQLKAVTKGHEEAAAIIESEAFKANVALVREWNETIEARNWLVAKGKAENEKTIQQDKLKALKADYMVLLEGLAFAEEERRKTVEALNQLPEVKPEELEQISTQLKTLRCQRDKAKELIQNVALVHDRREQYAKEKERKEKAAKALQDSQAEIGKKQKEAAVLEQPMHDAKVKWDAGKELLAKQIDTIDKFAQNLRQKLQVGDVCPVCRQVIANGIPHEEELNQLVDDLKKACADAELAYTDLEKRKNKLEAEIKADLKSYQAAKENYDNDHSVAEAVKKVIDGCKACGVEQIDENTPKILEEINDKAARELKMHETRIAGLEEKQLDYQKKARQRQALELKFKEISSTCEMTKQVEDELLKLIPEWSILEAADKVENTGLLKKANEVQRETASAVTQLRQAENAIGDNNLKLLEFLKGHADLNHERLALLNGYTPQSIGEMNSLIAKARDQVLKAQTLKEEAIKKLEDHRRVNPELKEEDTVENLNSRIPANEKAMADIAERKGAVNQELKQDEQNKTRLGQLMVEVEKKKEEYQKWARMNQLIGDATGNKFRKIAQSYVLSSLIHSANSYMKTLTDRYTLKVVPGTFVILMEDAYQGFATRAASTISGGESFLVSLSLALALSDIGQRLAVDTLFIDEGFGTLSGEPLQNAVNTLRTLHSKAGRHVGIISHVEELKEQIPVQIQVNQEGNESSSMIVIVP